MTRKSDRDYYLARIAAERAAAEAATSDWVRAVHLSLLERYEAHLASENAASPTRED
jgi:hypothetical protein